MDYLIKPTMRNVLLIAIAAILLCDIACQRRPSVNQAIDYSAVQNYFSLTFSTPPLVLYTNCSRDNGITFSTIVLSVPDFTDGLGPEWQKLDAAPEVFAEYLRRVGGVNVKILSCHSFGKRTENGHQTTMWVGVSKDTCYYYIEFCTREGLTLFK